LHFYEYLTALNYWLNKRWYGRWNIGTRLEVHICIHIEWGNTGNVLFYSKLYTLEYTHYQKYAYSQHNRLKPDSQ